MTSSHFQWRGDTLLLHCHIQPKASRDEIIGVHNQRLKVRITAPPVDGQANTHLLGFLARQFAVSKSAANLVRGGTGRDKTVAIANPRALPHAAHIGRP